MTSFLPRLVGVGSVKLIRSIHRSSGLAAKSSYEGDGKTTITILNRDSTYGLMIDGITTTGFRLNNGLWVLGPIILFPRSVFGWSIESTNDISEESLTLFKILEPTLDILVVGLDQKYDTSTPFVQTLKAFAKKQNTLIEILPVDHACTTFNYLNAENRYVAAALLPPRKDLPRELTAVRDAMERRAIRKPEKQIESE